MARRPKKSSSKVTVNMSGIEARVTVPEGDYRVAVDQVTREEGKNDDYLKWKLKIVGGKMDGKSLYNNTSLAPQALWNLANFLTALGEEIPDGELELDFEELQGKECMVVVQHEEYDSKPQAKIVDYYPVDGDAEEDEDEDEKPAKKGKASKAKSKDEDDEEDEDEKPAKRGRGRPAKAKAKDEDDEDEDEDEDEKPAKRGRGRPKKAAAEDDEDEEEEDEKVSKRGKGKKSKVVITAEEVDDMDEDELGDLIEKHDLDVDLDDYKTLRKKVTAVKDALEEKGLLHDA